MASNRTKQIPRIGGPATGVEAELQEKEAFNFALFQHNPTPMTIVDSEGQVVKSNLARRNSGRPLPPLGQPLFKATDCPDGADLHAALLESIRTGRVQHFAEQRMRDGWFSITMAPVPKGAIVVLEDITEWKRAQEEARIQQQQLIQAQKLAALGSLVSGVAHEVSNPNNVMLLSAATLKKHLQAILSVLDGIQSRYGLVAVGGRPYPQVRGEVLEQLEVISRAADRIQTLVKDLKAFASQESVALTESVDMNVVVRSAAALLQPMIRKATDRFSLLCQEPLPAVRGSARRLEQVVVNLISNACDALSDIHKAVVVETAYDKTRAAVKVIVRDEGSGISPEDLPRVKDPFFTTKRDTGGTGLGLSVSDKIVTAHGGTLTFDSVLKQGTTATLTLPPARSAEARIGRSGGSASGRSAPQKAGGRANRRGLHG
jgi:signal transduction histidine kinase